MDLVSFIFDVSAYTAIFVLVALGLGIIASMMGIFNFAHGEFVVLGALTVYLFASAGLPTWAGMIAAPVVAGIGGLIVERTVVRHLYKSPVSAMLATYAIGLIIREAVRLYLGGQYYSVPAPISGSLEVFGATVSVWRTFLIVASIAVVAAVYTLIVKTRWGLIIRGTLENPGLARVSGISTAKVYAATFSMGTALAGLAGGLIVPIYSINADLGVPFLIKSFLAIMTGGIGSFEGAAVGALLIGSATSAGPWFVNPVVAELLVFLGAITIVKLLPGGVLPSRRS